MRTITLAANQQITIACEGSGNVLTATNAQFNAAKCGSTASSSLTIGTTSYTYDKLGCTSQPKESFIESGTCGTGGVNVQIGWQQAASFIEQIKVCHVKSNANTLYTVHTVYGASATADDTTNTRPDFRKGNYYVGIDVATAYTQAQQTITMTNIVGSSTLAAKYIDVAKSYYFARGHLSPDGDFVDAASQDASYYFINAAPQWQSFNNGNWVKLESNVISKADATKADYTVYTGTYGTLTLPDVNGNQRSIYSAFNANSNGLIPAPKYYWKVVHDPVAKKAVAFVGINNPHLTSVSASDVFCTDICPQITWSTWTAPHDIPKGYMFCCTVADLRNTVTCAPDLGAVDLLV